MTCFFSVRRCDYGLFVLGWPETELQGHRSEQSHTLTSGKFPKVKAWNWNEYIHTLFCFSVNIRYLFEFWLFHILKLLNDIKLQFPKIIFQWWNVTNNIYIVLLYYFHFILLYTSTPNKRRIFSFFLHRIHLTVSVTLQIHIISTKQNIDIKANLLLWLCSISTLKYSFFFLTICGNLQFVHFGAPHSFRPFVRRNVGATNKQNSFHHNVMCWKCIS